jgi:hypothetical protein
MRIFLLLLAAGLSAQDFDGRMPTPPAVVLPDAPPAAAGKVVEPRNVVLVMFDGVRWQEFYGNKPDIFLRHGDAAPTFPYFWSTLAKQGAVYDNMFISNSRMLSLPAYQSIFAGKTQPCRDNDCGRIGVETFVERAKLGLSLAAEQVGVVASWDKIAFAVEHAAGTISVDAGKAGATRLDAETWPRAMAFLKTNRPRFLFISLNDADEHGHAGDYPAYLSSLRQYDRWLEELVKTLDGMGEYGRNTTLLVTTDHGRGVLWDWKDHGGRPWARRVWLYARNPRAAQKGIRVSERHAHADIRPTVETLLGETPAAGPGKPLAEALER